MPALPGYYTTTEAAKKLSINIKDIDMLCVDNKIETLVKLKDGSVLIPEKWIIEKEKYIKDKEFNRILFITILILIITVIYSATKGYI